MENRPPVKITLRNVSHDSLVGAATAIGGGCSGSAELLVEKNDLFRPVIVVLRRDATQRHTINELLGKNTIIQSTGQRQDEILGRALK